MYALLPLVLKGVKQYTDELKKAKKRKATTVRDEEEECVSDEANQSGFTLDDF